MAFHSLTRFQLEKERNPKRRRELNRISPCDPLRDVTAAEATALHRRFEYRIEFTDQSISMRSNRKSEKRTLLKQLLSTVEADSKW